MNTANAFQHTPVNHGVRHRGNNGMLTGCFALMLCKLPWFFIFFSPNLFSNPHWAGDTSRRSYKSRGCSINVNPRRIHRLQGSSIIHARRRRTDWIVTTQAGTDEEDEEDEGGMSCSAPSLPESWAGIGRAGLAAERATPTHPQFTAAPLMWLIFALSDPTHVCMSDGMNSGHEPRLAGLWYRD